MISNMTMPHKMLFSSMILVRHNFHASQSHFRSLFPASLLDMPFKDKHGNLLPTCNVDKVAREWKENPAVRAICVKRDRMFESFEKEKDGEPPLAIKINIKDCVHNRNILIPLLKRMAGYDHHPVPYVKALARENFVLYFIYVLFCLIKTCWAFTGYPYIYGVIFLPIAHELYYFSVCLKRIIKYKKSNAFQLSFYISFRRDISPCVALRGKYRGLRL